MIPEAANGVEDDDEDDRKVRFHYIKSGAFRTVHVDGLIGGLTPRMMFSLGLFSERRPYPDQIVHGILENGVLGPEIEEERLSRDGIVRELEVNVIMNLDVARTISDWLLRNINEAEEAIRVAKSQARQIKEEEGSVQ